MLGIWHRGDWMKRHLAQPIYGWVECGSPISSWFITFINEKFIPFIFICKCIDVYVDFEGSCVYGISVPIMLVICIFYDNNYLWLSTCSYLYKNG